MAASQAAGRGGGRVSGWGCGRRNSLFSMGPIPAWISARGVMERTALPTRRTEKWKLSDLRLALREAALPAEGAPPKHRWRELSGPIDRLAVAQDAHAITKGRAGDEEVLVERFDSDALDARVREIQVLPGGVLTRVVVQTGAGFALSAAYVSVAAGARYRQIVLAEGGKLARIETHVA